jgi:hypothetical protein
VTPAVISRHHKDVAEASALDGFVSSSDIFESVRWLRYPIKQPALL